MLLSEQASAAVGTQMQSSTFESACKVNTVLAACEWESVIDGASNRACVSRLMVGES